MTMTQPAIASAIDPRNRVVLVDLYRDIHKGIRSELFSVTEQAGRIDPADAVARRTLAARVQEVVTSLEQHAHHEDAVIEPTLERELPALAERIAADHAAFAPRTDALVEIASEAAAAPDGEAAAQVRRVYLELASFTGAYLAHQDLEEREVMPALDAAVGVEATAAMHQAIISSIPPDEMATALSFMIPAMNVDDRAELLGGMRAGAPAEVFDGVWSLVGRVLSPVEVAALAMRLELS